MLIRVGAFILAIPAGAVVGLLLFLTATDFHPEDKETIIIRGDGRILPQAKKDFTFLTWNIGYAGLGAKMDFFYEGGYKVRPLKNEFRGYLEGICQYLSSVDSLDFILLQETDLHSRRSYLTDEVMEGSSRKEGRCLQKIMTAGLSPCPRVIPWDVLFQGSLLIQSINRMPRSGSISEHGSPGRSNW
jgi:hypothetical protein